MGAMGQALYRKYRSKSFDELVGQEHITRTLKNALKDGRISHAYLFTGPRGIGKTSAARILAHAVNDLAYEDESIHLDIIEIDAASNRRIDEIRDLRDKVHISPTSAKYKVYIIDEVHMLTKEAFNALLKTLEEPPAHCIFILATTEVHKLPETIISRTQHFSFKPVSKSDVAKHLKTMAKNEKIDIDEQALDLLAEHGQGSFRDSISMLDQLAGTSKQINHVQVSELLGLPPDSSVDNLLRQLESGDSASVLSTLEELYAHGVTAGAIAAGLGKKLRQKIIENKTSNVSLLRALLDVPGSSQPVQVLELCLLESSQPKPVIKPNIFTIRKSTEAKMPGVKPTESEIVEEVAAKKAKEKSVTKTSFDMSLWPQVQNRVKKEAAALYTALRLCVPSYSAGILTLAFEFPLHQKKVENIKNKEALGKILEEVSGSNVRIETVVDKSAFSSDRIGEPQPELTPESFTKPADGPNEHLKTISNIFPAAEVLES